jgi:hypothetical protein
MITDDKMIVIKNDLWRIDCIAAIGYKEKNIQILPLGCYKYLTYSWDTEELAANQYRFIAEIWANKINQSK